MNFLKGYKTYLVMVVVIILSGVEGFSQWCGTLDPTAAPSFCFTGGVPAWVYTILATLGIYTRSVAKPK